MAVLPRTAGLEGSLNAATLRDSGYTLYPLFLRLNQLNLQHSSWANSSPNPSIMPLRNGKSKLMEHEPIKDTRPCTSRPSSESGVLCTSMSRLSCDSSSELLSQKLTTSVISLSCSGYAVGPFHFRNSSVLLFNVWLFLGAGVPFVDSDRWGEASPPSRRE